MSGWFVIVAVLVFLTWGNPRDDSDPQVGRSGMRVHTDALVGCQYLSSYGGVLTPRVDGNGRHVGCKR